jgi:hypothetical protein
MRQLSEVGNGFRICYRGTTLMLVGFAMLALGTAMVGVATAMTFVEIENATLVALAVGLFYVGGTSTRADLRSRRL